MVRYRRLVSSNPVFLTLVTQGRERWLGRPEIFEIYLSAFRDAVRHFKWRGIAWVMLPDHLHWLLDPKDKSVPNGSYSEVARRFKFSMTSAIQKNQPNEGGLWQDRFYEHTIKNETDLQRHFDCIHFNPVKHRIVQHSSQWKHSSFHYYVKRGWYPDEMEFDALALANLPGARYDV